MSICEVHKTAEKRKRCNGQIAVILILFIAVLLAALAVIMNVGKISQQRTAMTVATDSTVAFMASLFASYAESMYQSVIEPGPNKEDEYPLTRKETAAWVAQAVSLVIAIIGVVLAVVTGAFTGGASSAAIAFGVVAICSAILSAAALVIELAYVAPQTHQMWNKMFKYMKTYDQFREQGAQSIFSALISDPVTVRDVGDYNQDGYYFGDGTQEGAASKVSRFSILYTRRVEYLVKKSDAGTITDNDGIALYAWQDKIKEGDDPGSGKWHIVRTDVGVPMRCNKKCGRTQCEAFGNHCPEPFLPWVKQWTGTFNDYWSLIDAVNRETGEEIAGGICSSYNYKPVAYCFVGGLVMARANRYDESGGTFSWATGLNFWNTRFRDVAPGSASPDEIEAACGHIYKTDSGITGTSVDNGISYGIFDDDNQDSSQSGALLLNGPSSQNGACWTLLHQLLRQGMESRSCAEYFCRHGDEKYNQSRIGVKFVPCPENRWQ